MSEFTECLARVGCNKYSNLKQLAPAKKVEAFLQNFFGEFTEEEVMRDATYIHAVRYDLAESRPLEGESAKDHEAFLTEFRQLQLEGLYGWPLWEKDVHDLLHVHFKELASVFRAYRRSLGEKPADDSTATTMSLAEFKELATDVGLETTLSINKAATPAVYTLAMMEDEFAIANKSGKGLAGPAADGELLLHEFLNVLTRVSFHRLNPEYGELTMEHQDTLLPVPQCLERTLLESVLPKAHRDDAATFRDEVLSCKDVQSALAASKNKLQTWFLGLKRDANRKVGLPQWLHTLHGVHAFGTFTFAQGSDIVGDDRAGTQTTCRLSEQQAKLAFLFSQRDSSSKTGGLGAAIEDVTLDVDELHEALARCGVLKYQAVAQMSVGDKVAAMVRNVLGEQTEDQASPLHPPLASALRPHPLA